MSAAFQFVPVYEVAIALFGPATTTAKNFSGEYTAPHRYVNRLKVGLAHTFPVKACRAGGAVVQPIEHDIVQHLVAPENVFRVFAAVAFAIGPGIKFLDDPRHLSYR